MQLAEFFLPFASQYLYQCNFAGLEISFEERFLVIENGAPLTRGMDTQIELNDAEKPL